MAKYYWSTVDDFIQNGKLTRAKTDDLVEFEGFNNSSDGYTIYFHKTGAMGVASQTPIERNDNSLTDALGYVWEPTRASTAYYDGVNLNFPAPFGSDGAGIYTFIGTGWQFVDQPIPTQRTTSDLINATGTFENDVVNTTGFYTAGDSGGAQWKATSTTGLTPSQTPADRGAAELVDGSGRLWEIVATGGVVDTVDLGLTLSSTPAETASIIQAAINKANALGGFKCFLPSGEITSEAFTLKNSVILFGAGKDSTVLVRSGAGLLIETEGFDNYADNVKRSYSWHSSTAARNSQGYGSGVYIMVAASNTDFDNATWWLSNAGDTSTDTGWDEVSPVVGCVSGGFEDLTVDGDGSDGVGDVLVGYYGINHHIRNCAFRNAGIPLHVESPGSVFSTQVGVNLQGRIDGIECYQFTDTGFVNNSQSDGTVYDVMVFAPDNVVPTTALVHAKQKASGQKWFGSHMWGGDTGTIGLVMDAATVSMYGVEIERPVKVNAGGFRFDGQVYRINDASAEDGAAFTIAASVNSTNIKSRVNHFRHAINVTSPAGIGADFNVNHYSEDTSASLFDPSGSVSPEPSRTTWMYRSTGQGSSEYNIPYLRTFAIRPRRQLIPYATAIQPSIGSGNYIEVEQLTGNITINAPASSFQGDELQFMFQQDGTGSRTITWSSDFVGGPTAGGAAFTRRAVRFINDGVKWILSGDSGSWV